MKAQPGDGQSWSDLSNAYLRYAFRSADPSYYSLARDAIERASTLLDNSVKVRITRTHLLLALHQFPAAEREATSALQIDPANFDAQVALTDALIETGQYDSARDIVDKLVDQRPGVASLSRLSYLRQLTGDLAGSLAAMRSAVSAAPADSIDKAVALAYLGEVQLEQGSVTAAKRSFTQALELYPGSLVATIGLARIQAVQGDQRGAQALLEQFTALVPAPGAFGLQAEIARSLGDTTAAAQADELVDASVELLRANGSNVDADLALLLADRGPGSAGDAVVAARQAYADRKTIFTNDALAWALVQNGKPADAVPFIEAALATDPQVASINRHAAVIFEAVGDTQRADAAARKAERNPTLRLAAPPVG